MSDDGSVVADRSTLSDLLADLRRDSPDCHVAVQRIPSLDEPMFVGLG